jgi:hypothetical protein
VPFICSISGVPIECERKPTIDLNASRVLATDTELSVKPGHILIDSLLKARRARIDLGRNSELKSYIFVRLSALVHDEIRWMCHGVAQS